MKKLFYLLLIVAFGMNAQYSPSTNVNYVKFLKTPPTASPVTSDYWITLYNDADKFMYKASLNGLGYIPLTGTTFGHPITGILDFAGNGTTSHVVFSNGDDDGFEITSTFSGYNHIGVFQLGPGEIDFSTNDFDSGYVAQFVISTAYGLQVNSSDPAAKGITSIYDYTENISDLDFTQKKYVDGAIAAAISGGSGTVTSVTGTDGVTVANGTSTPVIGLGDITPDSIKSDDIQNNGGSFSVDSSGNISGNKGFFGNIITASNFSGTSSGTNTGDQDLSGYELLSNKQTTLTASATKYPTVNAVNTGLGLKQDLDSDLTAIAALSTTTFGRALLTETNAASIRSTIGAGTGSGTVTTASVVSANGFAGSVANATTTPAITVSTTVTGLLKGNGTAISAATAGTDYLTPTDLTNYVNKTTANTYTSGAKQTFAPSTTYAGLNIGAVTSTPSTLTGGDIFYNSATGNMQYYDSSISSTRTIVTLLQSQALKNKDLTDLSNTFPNLNQNTTGSAATLTTPRNINGVAFDGSANITVTAAAATLTGTTLNNTVTASSLTSFGANPVVGTQSANDNSTKAASTAYADAKVQNSTTASTTVAPSTTAVNTALSGYVKREYKSTTYSSAVTGTTSETVLLSIPIAAGEYAAGDQIQILAKTLKTVSTGTTTIKIHIGTAGTTADAQVAQNSNTNATLSSPLKRTFNLQASNVLEGFNFTANAPTDEAISAATNGTTALTPSSAFFITITATNAVSTDSTVLTAVSVLKI